MDRGNSPKWESVWFLFMTLTKLRVVLWIIKKYSPASSICGKTFFILNHFADKDANDSSHET